MKKRTADKKRVRPRADHLETVKAAHVIAQVCSAAERIKEELGPFGANAVFENALIQFVHTVVADAARRATSAEVWVLVCRKFLSMKMIVAWRLTQVPEFMSVYLMARESLGPPEGRPASRVSRGGGGG